MDGDVLEKIPSTKEVWLFLELHIFHYNLIARIQIQGKNKVYFLYYVCERRKKGAIRRSIKVNRERETTIYYILVQMLCVLLEIRESNWFSQC